MPKWQPSRGGEGAVCRVVSAPHAHGQRALSSPRGARRCRVRQGPPGACDGSNCSYLLKSSVPWWPLSRVLPAAFWGRRSVPIVPKGHVGGRVAFGPRPRLPWPRVRAERGRPRGWRVSLRGGRRLPGGWSWCSRQRPHSAEDRAASVRQHVREDVGLGTEERALSPGPGGVSRPCARTPACCRRRHSCGKGFGCKQSRWHGDSCGRPGPGRLPLGACPLVSPGCS